MLGPHLHPGIEQRNDLAGVRVHRGDIRPFAPIAVEAGQGQVARFGPAAVLFGDDVIGFMRPQYGAVGDEAVFAAPVVSGREA